MTAPTPEHTADVQAVLDDHRTRLFAGERQDNHGRYVVRSDDVQAAWRDLTAALTPRCQQVARIGTCLSWPRPSGAHCRASSANGRVRAECARGSCVGALHTQRTLGAQAWDEGSPERTEPLPEGGRVMREVTQGESTEVPVGVSRTLRRMQRVRTVHRADM